LLSEFFVLDRASDKCVGHNLTDGSVGGEVHISKRERKEANWLTDTYITGTRYTNTHTHTHATRNTEKRKKEERRGERRGERGERREKRREKRRRVF